jgi:hypothetical protein
LRADPDFDNLIKVFYPNIEEFEDLEQSMIEAVTAGVSQKDLVARVKRGMRKQLDAVSVRFASTSLTQQAKRPSARRTQRRRLPSLPFSSCCLCDRATSSRRDGAGVRD